MKLVSFSKNGEEGFGIFSQSGIYPVLEKFKNEFTNLKAVIDSQKIEDFEAFCESNPIPVSYTHLTLPTILLV